jgi:hypothetical protein
MINMRASSAALPGVNFHWLSKTGEPIVVTSLIDDGAKALNRDRLRESRWRRRLSFFPLCCRDNFRVVTVQSAHRLEIAAQAHLA